MNQHVCYLTDLKYEIWHRTRSFIRLESLKIKIFKRFTEIHNKHTSHCLTHKDEPTIENAYNYALKKIKTTISCYPQKLFVAVLPVKMITLDYFIYQSFSLYPS